MSLLNSSIDIRPFGRALRISLFVGLHTRGIANASRAQIDDVDVAYGWYTNIRGEEFAGIGAVAIHDRDETQHVRCAVRLAMPRYRHTIVFRE